jgi:hypothetical protein
VPDAPELLGHHVVTLDFRPSVAAWLIPTSDRDALHRAVRGAARRWAGLGEPVIPVSPTGQVRPYWRQVLDILRPDLAVNVGLPPETASRAAGALRVVPERQIDHLTHGCHQLAVADIGALRDRYVMRGTGTLRDDAALGSVPEDELADWGTVTNLVEGDAGCVGSARSQLERTSVLHVALEHAGEIHATNISALPVVLWVSSPASYRDVLWFWNYRALASRTIWPARMALVEPSIGEKDRFGEVLRDVVAHSARVEPAVILNSHTVPGSALRQIARRLGLVGTTATGMRRPVAGTGVIDAAPVDYVERVELKDALTTPRRYGSRAYVSTPVVRPHTRLDIASPVPINHRVRGTVRLRIAELPETAVPQRETVARLYHQNAYWEDPSVLGLVVSPTRRMFLDLAIPTPPDVFTAALADRGVTWTLSNAGVYGHALLQEQSAVLFRRASVLRIVQALTTPRSKSLAAELRRLPPGTPEAAVTRLAAEWGGRAQQSFGIVETLVSRLPGITKAAVGDAAEELCAANLAERGAVVACTTCSLRSFVPLAIARGRARCPACGAREQYVRAGAGGMAVAYRLNALLDRASDNGVVMHLAGMGLLGDRPDCNLWPGVDLVRGSLALGEADVCGYAGRDLVLGEAKTSAAEFTKQQVRRDMTLVEAVGADVYVMISMGTPDEGVLAYAERAARSIGSSLELVVPS